jgi:UDP-N-acetylglucosamine--N-acetylmuramyl-(pentapeptide) pyrophosphoryl-undecaprenol N-acetylglucosamine transferase
LRPDRHALLRQWGFPPDARVLLVFGGSQGSRAINEAVAVWAKEGLPAGWSVIWATGKNTYAEFRASDAPRLRVVPYLSPIADAYAVTDLALVRGGMMGTAECCAWGIPMIVVPLPTAAADHQTWNARALEAGGAAIHLPQTDLTAGWLHSTIADLATDERRLRALADGARKLGHPGAAADIARRIAALLPQ